MRTVISQRQAEKRCKHQTVINLNNLTVPKRVKNITKTQQLRIAHINTRSACNKKSDQVHDLITDQKLDILGLTETWFIKSKTDTNAVLPPGYSIQNLPRATHGGGVAVIYRNNLSLIKSKQHTFISLECLDC